MTMENNKTQAIRIPRPRGVTQAVISKNDPQARQKLITAYLAGIFPFNESLMLSKEQFSELYGIPLIEIHRRIKDGLVDNLLDGTDLVRTLEEERLNAFSQVLYRIGASDLHTNHLLHKLLPTVLSQNRPNALLIKELNAAIGNQIRLSDTQLKAIVLMNQALMTVDNNSDSDAEELLTREEILREMENFKLEPEMLAESLKDTPDLSPPGMARSSGKRNLNKEAEHDFQRALDVPIPSITPAIVIGPK